MIPPKSSYVRSRKLLSLFSFRISLIVLALLLLVHLSQSLATARSSRVHTSGLTTLPGRPHFRIHSTEAHRAGFNQQVTDDLQHTFLVIFKHARSGSSWLGSLFDQVRFINGKRPVIIPEADACENRLEHLEDYIWAFSASLWNEEAKAKLEEICVDEMKRKCCRSLSKENISFVGVTTHPLQRVGKKESFLSLYQKVKRLQPQMRVVGGYLVRTNLVKWAISYINMYSKVDLCKEHTKKLTSDHLDCYNKWKDGEIKFRWKTFANKLASLHEYWIQIRDMATHLTDGPVPFITYESLQIDPKRELQKFFQMMGG